MQFSKSIKLQEYPLISVIVPTYNRLNFLKEVSIPSILHQTYPNFELIIVDDHSSDGSEQFIKSLSKRDRRIKYIKNFRKKGVSGARNSGILISKGKYVSFLDSDDAWVPEHLEDLLYYLEKYPEKIDIISAAQVLVDFKTKKEIACFNLDIYEKYPGFFLEKAFVFSGDLFELALKMFLFNDCAMLAKRGIFDTVLYPEDIHMNEDSFFVLNVAYHGFKVAFLPKIHLYYHLHDYNTSNVSKINDPKKNIFLGKEQIKFAEKCLKTFQLKLKHKKIIQKRMANCYCWILAYNGYLPLGDLTNFIYYFKQGLILDPLSFKKWKTFLKYLFLLKIKKLRNMLKNKCKIICFRILL